MVRASTKLEYAWGFATAMAEAIGDKSPNAQQLPGELWSYAELTRAAVQAAEDRPKEWSNGVWCARGSGCLGRTKSYGLGWAAPFRSGRGRSDDQGCFTSSAKIASRWSSAIRRSSSSVRSCTGCGTNT